jgi:hypothetical protein
MASPSCPRCQGRMEEGFVVDEGYGSRTVSAWIEGVPIKSFWSGLKTKGKRRLPIQTWRCMRCGVLESYAS